MAKELPAREARNRYLAIDRLAALVDGVFAIAATLLAVEISVPIVREAASGSELTTALLEQWPSYVAYAVTFFLIGAYWINHHRMFNLLRGVNHTFLALNILCLMVIAITPFPNAVLAEYVREPELRGVASAVYGTSMLVLAVMFNVVWWYAFRQGLFKTECDSAAILRVLRSYLIGPAVYLTATALAFVVPVVSLAMFVLVVFGYWAEGPVSRIREGYIETGE